MSKVNIVVGTYFAALVATGTSYYCCPTYSSLRSYGWNVTVMLLEKRGTRVHRYYTSSSVARRLCDDLFARQQMEGGRRKQNPMRLPLLHPAYRSK